MYFLLLFFFFFNYWSIVALCVSQVALVVKNLLANARDIIDAGSIPGSGRSPGGGIATHFTIVAWRIAWAEHNSGYIYGGASLMDP